MAPAKIGHRLGGGIRFPSVPDRPLHRRWPCQRCISRKILNDRYLLYIAGFSLLFTLVKTNGDHVLARAVEDAANLALSQGRLPASHVQNYIGEVFANITFWVDVISLAFKALGGSFCANPSADTRPRASAGDRPSSSRSWCPLARARR